MRKIKIQTKRNSASEKIIHSSICDYLKLQYPNIIFTSDASGMRTGMGLRLELKRKRCVHYKIPDLIILEPRSGYSGLVIEIKKSVSDVFKKNGDLKDSDHLREQEKTIKRLGELGYKAAFGCGFEHSKKIIDEYLK